MDHSSAPDRCIAGSKYLSCMQESALESLHYQRYLKSFSFHLSSHSFICLLSPDSNSCTSEVILPISKPLCFGSTYSSLSNNHKIRSSIPICTMVIFHRTAFSYGVQVCQYPYPYSDVSGGDGRIAKCDSFPISSRASLSPLKALVCKSYLP